MLEQAVSNLDEWMKFWGFSEQQFLNYKVKAQMLDEFPPEQWYKFPDLPKHVIDRESYETYVNNTRDIWRKWEKRIVSLGISRANLQKFWQEDKIIFFTLTLTNSDRWGTAYDSTQVLTLVNTATSKATRARTDVFDNVKKINPHAFRHIAEKHIRTANPEQARSFGMLIGHTERMGDEYASQITSKYELTESIVDDWWLGK
jgi:hypothetical protein